jgi:hypothetical protein
MKAESGFENICRLVGNVGKQNAGRWVEGEVIS